MTQIQFETCNVPAMHAAIQAVIPVLREWLEGAGSCAYACKAQASARVDVPTAPMQDSFSCFSKGRALSVKVKHGAQLHAQHTCDVHGGPRSVFSLELFVQMFFKLVHLMGGADWSLADVQFVRDGMASGANLSLLARSRVSFVTPSAPFFEKSK